MTSSEGGGLRAYAALLRRPHVARFLLGGVIMQFPYAMVNMALLIGARDVYGSYSSAGVAAAVMSIAGAVIGPTIGRLIDRHGQSRIASLVGAFWNPAAGSTWTTSPTSSGWTKPRRACSSGRRSTTSPAGDW